MAAGREWPPPENDRFAFFGFFVLGAAWILLFRTFGWSPWVVTGIPCALMVAYAYTSWDREEKRPKYAFAGDNLYYLGFLYTLTSLAHALIVFDPEEAGTETIITNFGIAIATTILGMALRVVVGQRTEETLETVDEEVRTGLGDAARRLRGEIEFTVDEFQSFRERTREALEEGLAEVRAQLAEAADTSARIGDGLTGIEEKGAALAETTGKAWEGIGADADRVRLALVSMTERIAGFDFYEAFVARAIDLASGKLRDAVEQHADEVRQGTEELRSGLKELTREFDAIGLRGVVREAVEPVSRDLREASTQLAGSAGAVREAVESARGAEETAGDLRAGLETVAGALASVGDRVAAVGKDSGNSLSRSIERVEQANAQLEQSLKRMAELMRRAAEEKRRRRIPLLGRLFGKTVREAPAPGPRPMNPRRRPR